MVEECPKKVRYIMSKCIIIKCEHNYSSDMLEYQAISPMFKKVLAGCELPVYQVLVSGYRKVVFY
jgi:hypothetical protein